MTKREELEKEIEHLEKNIEHLADEERALEVKIIWFSRLRDMAQAEIDDIDKEEGMDYCERCNSRVPGWELNKELKCFECTFNHNEDEFDR